MLFIYVIYIIHAYIYITCIHIRTHIFRQQPKWNVNTEQRDEIGVAVKSWLWERVELMAW